MISVNAKYWILITQVIGYNNPKVRLLAENYSDISQFFINPAREARLCGIFTPNEAEKFRSLDMNAADKIIARCVELGYSVISVDDPEYPTCLFLTIAPPAVLYVWGRLPDLESTLSVGIVGTRSATHYGLTNSYKMGYSLGKYGAVIVSGGALGVDCASHRGALAADGVTVCVRGCGINYPYLPDNAEMRSSITKRGAVISEYPPDERARAYYFPARNRIIAALSKALLVIEAGERSGSLITARLALEYGKDVFALLGNVEARNLGSNKLITDHLATPVSDFMDIIANYSRLGEEFVCDFGGYSLEDIKKIPVKSSPIYGRYDTYPEMPAPVRKTPTKKPKKQAAKRKAEPVEAAPAAAVAEPKPRKRVDLEGDPAKVYECLGDEPINSEAISVSTGLPVNKVLSILTLLELKGLISQLPGRLFALK